MDSGTGSTVLTWNHLKADVQIPGNSQTIILDDVSGEAYAGQLLAIMGASGAGKTTLLNILTGVKTSSVRYSGRIEINGQLVSREELRRKTAYVRQFEDYYPCLTVREHLQFYAELKLGGELSGQQIAKKVENLIDELQLANCASNYVGIPGAMKTLSGGEYKRLVLASEILSDVSVINCDEPTTGLDSHMAEEVVKALRLTADRGRVVICTIHQPSSRVFSLFDRLMLLSDGRVAYNGNREDATAFFNSLELTQPANINPADFFIRTLAVKPGYEEACRARNRMICQRFRNVQPSARIIPKTTKDVDAGDKEKGWKGEGASIVAQMRLLMWRSLIMKWRTERSWLSTLATQLIVTVIYVTIYWQQEASDVGATNTNNGLFMLLLGLSFFYLIHEALGLSINQRLTFKERNQNLYGTVVFLFSSFFSWVIWYTLPLLLNINIIYWCIGLPASVVVYFKVLLLIYLSVIASLCFGARFSALKVIFGPNLAAILYVPLINNFYLMTQFSNILLSLLIIPSGFWVNVRTIPTYFKWIKEISWFSYLLDNVYTSVWKDFGPLECKQPSSDGSCADTGIKLLKTIGFEKDNFGYDVAFLVLLSLIYIILGNILFNIRARLFKE